MGSSRVPYDMHLFASYLRRTNNNLQIDLPPAPTTGTIFGWTTTEVADWNAKTEYFLDSVNGIFTKHEDPLQDTTDINRLVKNFIHDFHPFSTPLLDRAAASPLSTESLATLFNFIIGHAAASHVETSIKKELFGIYDQLGGGEVEVSTRTNIHSKRPALNTEEGSDGVEVAYTIGDVPMPDPEVVGTTHKEFSSASFILKLGVANGGKSLNISQRSIIKAHREYDGPWSKTQTITLL